jgi:hypothetical protein
MFFKIDLNTSIASFSVGIRGVRYNCKDFGTAGVPWDGDLFGKDRRLGLLEPVPKYKIWLYKIKTMFETLEVCLYKKKWKYKQTLFDVND